jgi:hypothetical protein
VDYVYWKVGVGAGVLLAIVVGLALRPSGRPFRVAVITINGFFLVWALISALRFFGLLPELPEWTLANVTFLGLILHLVWCAVAAGLLSLIALLSRWARGRQGRPNLHPTT